MSQRSTDSASLGQHDDKHADGKSHSEEPEYPDFYQHGLTNLVEGASKVIDHHGKLRVLIRPVKGIEGDPNHIRYQCAWTDANGNRCQKVMRLPLLRSHCRNVHKLDEVPADWLIISVGKGCVNLHEREIDGYGITRAHTAVNAIAMAEQLRRNAEDTPSRDAKSQKASLLSPRLKSTPEGSTAKVKKRAGGPLSKASADTADIVATSPGSVELLHLEAGSTRPRNGQTGSSISAITSVAVPVIPVIQYAGGQVTLESLNHSRNNVGATYGITVFGDYPDGDENETRVTATFSKTSGMKIGGANPVLFALSGLTLERRDPQLSPATLNTDPSDEMDWTPPSNRSGLLEVDLSDFMRGLSESE